MPEVLVGFGGNLGQVRSNLNRAVGMFCDGTMVRLRARSSDYHAPPWGTGDQPDFINLCILADTDLSPSELLDRAMMVERAFGRDRARERHWGPRTVDIDLIDYDEKKIQEPNLSLPHPRWFERAFVLAPLAEIVPDRRIAGIPIRDALERVDTSGIERLPPLRQD